MRQIKIKFSDFWGGFDSKSNFWTQILDKIKVPYEVVSGECDLLISSVFGNSHLQINDCRKKMIWIGENIRANNYYNYFDKVYSFDYVEDEKNFRFPLYLIDIWERDIDVFCNYRNKSKEDIKEDFEKRKFSIFVCSNPNYNFRNIYFYKMNNISRVDSYGKLFNNMGFDLLKDRESKIKKSTEYKFSMCFENGNYEGYVTEKINDGFRSGGIPIYFGSPKISEEFNEKSFINVNSIGVENSLELIKNINNDFELYYEYYSQPIISSKQKTFEDRFRHFKEDFLCFLRNIK
jgi:hypothetical protein